MKLNTESNQYKPFVRKFEWRKWYHIFLHRLMKDEEGWNISMWAGMTEWISEIEIHQLRFKDL